MWYRNIAGIVLWISHNQACDTHKDAWTDRQTNGPNYNSQDCASRAVKNLSEEEINY